MQTEFSSQYEPNNVAFGNIPERYDEISLPILTPVPSSSSAVPPVESKGNNVKVYTESRVESLENQVKALNEIFDIQEKTLSMTAPEVAQLSFRHFVRSYQSASSLSSVALPKIDTKDLQQRLQQFPFLNLLTMWRKQVLQCKISESLLEKQLEITSRKQKEDRENWKSQSHDYETQVLKWKNKSLSLSEKCDILVKEQEQLRSTLEQEKNLHQRTQQRLSEFHKTLQSLVHYLIGFRHQADEQNLKVNAMMMKYQEKLTKYQDKMQQMEERIRFLQAVFYEKNLEIRNTMATLEAERRMLNVTALASNNQHNMKSDENAESCSASSVYLSDLRISSESESLLKAIFRNLDQEDCGQLSPSTLFLTLTGIDLVDEQDSDGEDDDIHETEETISSSGNWPLSPVGDILQQRLGYRPLRTLLQRLHDLTIGPSKDSEITWGEFLLQLIPDPSKSCTSTRSALTNNELRRLQELDLVESFDLGVVPLAVNIRVDDTVNGKFLLDPVEHTCCTKKKKGRVITNDDVGDKDVSHEISRLRMERQYLMEKLQSATRSITRRAEGIKSFFESELTKLRVREQSTSIELNDLQLLHQQAQERIQQMAIAQQEQHDRYERQLQLVNEENRELRGKISELRTSQCDHYEKLLEEEKKRNDRLQQEYQHLQREMGKKEVKVKGLQRDLLHLQASQSNQKNEIQHKDEELKLLTDKLNALVENHEVSRLELEQLIKIKEANWILENQELLKKLADTQEEVIRLNKIIADAQTLAPLPPVTTPIVQTFDEAQLEENVAIAIDEKKSKPSMNSNAMHMPRKFHAADNDSYQGIRDEMEYKKKAAMEFRMSS